jgi:translation initiation factor 4E
MLSADANGQHHPDDGVSAASYPLKTGFTFWYLDKAAITSAASYDSCILPVNPSPITTTASFWAAFQHLSPPSSLSHSLTLHLFRHPVRPSWEHPANSAGGKLQLRVRKAATDRVWEELVLMLIGDAWGLGDEVVGLVLQVKEGGGEGSGGSGDVISVWNRSARDADVIARMKQVIARVLAVDRLDCFDYRPHQTNSNKSLHSPAR